MERVLRRQEMTFLRDDVNQHFHFTEVKWSLGWLRITNTDSVEHVCFQFPFAVQTLEAPCV